ncbi:DNA repair protein RadA [Microaerobacter geothermalis]|uniref:DNA repair protein RadA n=1 Tax=Microaerobacter geothermalis TaxID=674972 RepID=UPI001F2D7A7A|nr:DNA repair protein RadA [Microaerobacter geothermalis]MCF6095188.1 DNA repair protein RadA [Microaerobacter geothermalis]
MAKYKSKFACQQCGYESPKWMGKCPGCLQWNTMVEEKEIKGKSGRSGRWLEEKGVPQPITEIDREDMPRFDTGIGELNRVLGGGIVPGSLILVGGDPGIGKSTLLLQMSQSVALHGKKVLYLSGEESIRQIKLRAERLNVRHSHLFVLSETNVESILEETDRLHPDLLIVDSIQTIYHPDIPSAPGSVTQVRECTSHLMKMAKTRGIATFIVGHVTKQGDIAGPRLLEHMVDAVLYFEGERHHMYRILRAVKNRFGSTNEIGIFEMKESGLQEVHNPSEIFLSERPIGVAGSTVVASMEGTRPVLVEIQALISPSGFGQPRRMAIGVDHHKVSLLMAVLEKRVGILLQNQDAFVNVAGGVRLDEPAIDLSIAVAIASSFRDKPTHPKDVIIGEVGLTGEVRGVSRIEQRVNEAKKLGFKRIIIPEKNRWGWEIPSDIDIIGVHSVGDALDVAIGG